MPEVLNYVPAKEGLTVLGAFVAGKAGFSDLPPFTLPVPVRYKTDGYRGYCFDYRLGSYKRGGTRYLTFHLLEEQVDSLGESIYVIPHTEVSRGRNHYYWLNFHAMSETDSSVLSSCRLRPEEETHKIDFLSWHGLEEQILADYILGNNGLKFADLLPWTVVVLQKGGLYYRIAEIAELLVKINKSKVSYGDNLRFTPRTDDQRLYEWINILKIDEALPEEEWPLVSSCRMLLAEHRIYSKGWFGPERQLLLEYMKGRADINFANLRPLRVKAVASGATVYFFPPKSTKLRGYFNLEGVLASGEETISIPKQDNNGIYEWLELYRFDVLTKGPRGEILASARLTTEGLNQRSWLGIEKQLLKDYANGLVSFEYLKPITIKMGKNKYIIGLWWQKNTGRGIDLTISRSFGLKPDDELTLIPEKETEEGTDFLLVKDGTTLARYRLDLKTKKFTCIDNLVAKEQRASTDGWVEILKEYEQRLLSGEKLSYEEFMKGRQI